jgi:hypothetical protein
MGSRSIQKDRYTEKIVLHPRKDLEKLLLFPNKSKFSIVSKIMYGSFNLEIPFEMMKVLNPVDVYSILYATGKIKSNQERFEEFTEKYKDTGFSNLIKKLDDEAYGYKIKVYNNEYSLFGFFKKIQRNEFGGNKPLYSEKYLLSDEPGSLEKRTENLPAEVQFDFYDSFFRLFSVPTVVTSGEFTTITDYLRYITQNLNLERSKYKILNSEILVNNDFRKIRKVEVLSLNSGNTHFIAETTNKITDGIKRNCSCEQYEYSKKDNKTCNAINFYLLNPQKS